MISPSKGEHRQFMTKKTSSISIIGPFFKINLISSSGNSFVEIPQVN